jgi:hypothetical protein
MAFQTDQVDEVQELRQTNGVQDNIEKSMRSTS